MSLETVQFVGPIFVTVATIACVLALVIGAAGDVAPPEERKRDRSE
jgi:hypothetical protein